MAKGKFRIYKTFMVQMAHQVFFVNDIPERGDHSTAEDIAMWPWEKVAPDLPALAEIEVALTDTITVS